MPHARRRRPQEARYRRYGARDVEGSLDNSQPHLGSYRALQGVTWGLSGRLPWAPCDPLRVPLLLLGLLAGTALGVFLGSLFAVNARQRGEEDANELADAMERDDPADPPSG